MFPFRLCMRMGTGSCNRRARRRPSWGYLTQEHGQSSEVGDVRRGCGDGHATSVMRGQPPIGSACKFANKRRRIEPKTQRFLGSTKLALSCSKCLHVFFIIPSSSSPSPALAGALHRRPRANKWHRSLREVLRIGLTTRKVTSCRLCYPTLIVGTRNLMVKALSAGLTRLTNASYD